MLGESIHISTMDDDVSGDGLVDIWKRETDYFDFDKPRWQKGNFFNHIFLFIEK